MTDSSEAVRGADETDPMVGSVLGGRYRIEGELGRGGMGTVYRGRHIALDRPVAIKLLHARLTADPEVAKRFDREALAASKLDHPNIVRVHDAGAIESGARFIVMELLQGHELRDVGEEPLVPARAVDLAIQILRGLEHAHRRGFVHRDIKPENVFLVRDDDGREIAKLVDFGIVKLVAEGGDDKLTRAGLVFGTPRYMAPEQAGGGKVDERADLYAVGVLLYEMLAGTPPFDADEPALLLRMALVADPPPLPETVPAPLSRIVMRLLEKSPKDRFATAREVREALEGAVKGIAEVPAASAGASFGDAATAAHAVTPMPAAAVSVPSPPAEVPSVPPPGASAPFMMVPPSGVYRTVIATPAPVAAPRPRDRPNAIVLLVLLVTATAVIAWVTLTIRECASGSGAAAADASESPPAIGVPVAAPPAASPTQKAAGTEPSARESEEDEDEEEKDEHHKGKGKGKGKKKRKDEHSSR